MRSKRFALTECLYNNLDPTSRTQKIILRWSLKKNLNAYLDLLSIPQSGGRGGGGGMPCYTEKNNILRPKESTHYRVNFISCY